MDAAVDAGASHWAVAAVAAVARALDAWEGWVMLALVVPVLTVQWLRYRHGGQSPA